MSYVHEGNTDAAVAEVDKMAAIDKAGNDQVALAGTYAQAGNILLEAGRLDAAAARFKERDATIAKADVAAQVKDGAKRQALFDEARIALGKSDLATAKTKAAAYATAVGAIKIPFELRQSRELAGRIALAEKDYKTAAAAFREANQQDPRVLYLTALADRGKGDLAAAKQASAQAADWNALSPTYGYVRGKAKAMLQTADKD
jgi:tetratricopeptide (TPR) repeat protein